MNPYQSSSGYTPPNMQGHTQMPFNSPTSSSGLQSYTSSSSHSHTSPSSQSHMSQNLQVYKPPQRSQDYATSSLQGHSPASFRDQTSLPVIVDQTRNEVCKEETKLFIAESPIAPDSSMNPQRGKSECVIRTCLVCGEGTKTIHYGIPSCEGCKSFFARAIQSHNSFSCTTGDCVINKETRNRCMSCRWKKCLEVGMSKKGSKLGRRSKDVTQQLKDATPVDDVTRPVNQKSSLPFVKNVDMSKAIVPLHPHIEIPHFLEVPFFDRQDSHLQNSYHKRPRDHLYPRNLFEQQKRTRSDDPESAGLKSVVPVNSPSNYDFRLGLLAKNIHEKRSLTLVYLCDHGKAALPAYDFKSMINQCYMEVQSPEEMFKVLMGTITDLLQRIIRFAKELPFFQELKVTEKVGLIKDNMFEIVTIQQACMTDLETNRSFFLGHPHILHDITVCHASLIGTVFKRIMDFTVRFLELKLHRHHVSLFCAYIILTPDCRNFERRREVEEVRIDIMSALRQELQTAFPSDHDVIFLKLMSLTPLLREINREHAEMIHKMDNSIQSMFPPIHHEIFQSGEKDE